MAQSHADIPEREHDATVHVLHEGRALCGAMDGVPRDWPEGHWWVELRHVNTVTCGCTLCAGCERAAQELLAR